MSKFDILKTKGTNGINCDLETEDVIAKLQAWDDSYGITIANVEHDRLDVTFAKLPDDMQAFAEEVYAFCPDVVDQGFGCMDDMFEMAEATGQDIPAETLAFVDGVDFSDENFGVELLRRALVESKMVALWWD